MGDLNDEVSVMGASLWLEANYTRDGAGTGVWKTAEIRQLAPRGSAIRYVRRINTVRCFPSLGFAAHHCCKGFGSGCRLVGGGELFGNVACSNQVAGVNENRARMAVLGKS